MNSQFMTNAFSAQFSGESFEVIDPAAAAPFAVLNSSSAADIDLTVAQAAGAFTAWKQVTDAEIHRLFSAIAADIRSQKADLAKLITQEQGKPLFLAEAEVELGAGWIDHLRDIEIPVEQYEEANGKVIRVYNKPIGVVASITPWNWPFMIAVWHLFPALKTKNCVINKPSEYTPLSTIKLIEIINRHLPAGVCSIVLGKGDAGAYLTAHPDIGKVAFTGSTRTGQAILKNSAESLKSVVLELGGNDAAIVLNDADLEAVADKIFGSAFLNMGQTCTAIKRLYVQDGIYDALVEKLLAMAQAQVIGSGLEPAVTFGPVQNAMQYQKVKALMDDAIAQGASVLTAKTPVPEHGYFIAPTIISDLPAGTALIDQEQFGPVLPVIRFNDIQSVIAEANRSEFGLGGSVWSADLAKAEAVAHQLETGTVWINRHAEMSPNAAFCGWKMSGLGHAFGLSGLLQFTKKQAIHINP